MAAPEAAEAVVNAVLGVAANGAASRADSAAAVNEVNAGGAENVVGNAVAHAAASGVENGAESRAAVNAAAVSVGGVEGKAVTAHRAGAVAAPEEPVPEANRRKVASNELQRSVP